MASDLTEAEAPVEAALEGGVAEPEAGRSRRALLKGLGVAAAGAVLGGVLSPKEAQAHGGFHQDFNGSDPAIHGNNTSAGLGVRGDSALGVGVEGHGDGGGVVGISASGGGVTGFSNSGIGVWGQSNTDDGVFGLSDSGPGVTGVSTSSTGVGGHSNNGIGVDGSSESLIGVNGFSPGGIGVEGRSDTGIGVDGNGGSVGVIGSSDSGGTGVLAQNFGSGLALSVVGRAKFSTAGAGVIPAFQDSAFVSNPAVTGDSHITVTLTGTPGPVISGFPAVLHWVERQTGGFVIHMTRRVGQATPFTYLIVDPG